MTAEELYTTFSLLLNKNNEDQNINIEKAHFVLLYNRESERTLSEYIERNNSSDNIYFTKDFLKSGQSLDLFESDYYYYLYTLPEDFFHIVSDDISSVVNNSCKTLIYNRLIKPNEISSKLRDKFSKPSLTWERGLSVITEEGLKVYVDNYKLKSTEISYWKRPTKIDIEGYEDFDGKDSTNVDPEYSDYFSNLVLDRLVLEIQREYIDPGIQLSASRLTQF